MGKRKKKIKKAKRQQRSFYEGAQYTRLNSDWLTDTGATGDFAVHTSADRLRYRARSLDRDNAYVVSAMDKLCIKVLGASPPIFQSRIKKLRGSEKQSDKQGLNQSLNASIERAFKLWSEDKKSIHAGQQFNLTQILELCLRTLAIDGEVFVRKVTLARGRSPVKLALELIEADNLADMYHGDYHGNPIVNGIEYDEWSAPVAYWFYPYNPNDSIFGYRRSYGTDGTQPIRYPANEVIHLFSPRRVTQGRGVSWFASTIMKLRDLYGYEQATLIGARMRAAVMGFIQSPEGEEGFGTQDPRDSNAPREYSFEPGTIQVLNEGEEFTLADAKDPGPNLEGFGRYMLKAIAASLNIAYSSVSGDYSQANYSSERANKLDENRGIGKLQNHLITCLLCEITNEFIDRAVMQGVVAVPPGRANKDYLCQYKFRLAGFEFVDPQKDASAYKIQLENGMTSLIRVLNAKGIDLHELIEERKYENELLEEAGISVDYIAAVEAKEKSESEEGEGPEEEAEIQEGLTAVRSLLASRNRSLQLLSTQLNILEARAS